MVSGRVLGGFRELSVPLKRVGILFHAMPPIARQAGELFL